MMKLGPWSLRLGKKPAHVAAAMSYPPCMQSLATSVEAA
jgi:predicted nucleic acid-binding Zn ribbon protein